MNDKAQQPTYEQYKAHAKARGFQPITETCFKMFLAIGFNPMVGAFVASGETK